MKVNQICLNIKKTNYLLKKMCYCFPSWQSFPFQGTGRSGRKLHARRSKNNCSIFFCSVCRSTLYCIVRNLEDFCHIFSLRKNHESCKRYLRVFGTNCCWGKLRFFFFATSNSTLECSQTFQVFIHPC